MPEPRSRKRSSTEARFNGSYLLRTSDTLSLEEVVFCRTQPQKVVLAFRELKHTLDLRSSQHRLPQRIEA